MKISYILLIAKSS